MKKLVVLLFSFQIIAQNSSFIEEAERKTAPILAKILSHPFILELANGTLSRSRFDYFNKQDALYDWRYADALLKLASRSEDPEYKSFLVTAANHSTAGWTASRPKEHEQCAFCEAYSDFEELSALDSFSGGLASIAPCYVVYWKVCSWLKEHSVSGNPYQTWIDDYSTRKYRKHVQELTGFLNAVAREESQMGVKDMLYRYAQSAEYELLFWNSAYTEGS